MHKPRIVDRDFLNYVKTLPCLVCGKYGCDPCHLKTVKSGGDDTPDNVIPMCREHHSQQHQWGFKKFIDRYPKMSLHLWVRGWKLEDEFGVMKLRRVSHNVK